MALVGRGHGLVGHMSAEETIQRFRNLVIGVFMNDLSYTEVPFSFKTVFHLTPYSYRCCPCSYEFEYLDFLSDTGEINETMFENLLQSLAHYDDTLVQYTAIFHGCKNNKFQM